MANQTKTSDTTKTASKAAPKQAASAKATATETKVAAEATVREFDHPAIKTLAKMGKAKGNLTDDEIQGALADVELTVEQFERGVHALSQPAGSTSSRTRRTSWTLTRSLETVANAEPAAITSASLSDLDAPIDDTEGAEVVDIQIAQGRAKATAKKKTKKRATDNARGAADGRPGPHVPEGDRQGPAADRARRRSTSR